MREYQNNINAFSPVNQDERRHCIFRFGSQRRTSILNFISALFHKDGVEVRLYGDSINKIASEKHLRSLLIMTYYNSKKYFFYFYKKLLTKTYLMLTLTIIITESITYAQREMG